MLAFFMATKTNTETRRKVLDKIYEELKAVPLTLLLVCFLYLAVGIMWRERIPREEFYALKHEMSRNSKSVTLVQLTLQKDHLDTRVHAIDQEIFNLRQHMADEDAHGRKADQLYTDRVHDLTNQETQIGIDAKETDDKIRAIEQTQ